MAEKKNLTKLSKNELVEMLQRQEKILLNRKFVKSLPDKGEKIQKLIEKLKQQIVKTEHVEDLSSRFKRINIDQPIHTSQGQKSPLDSDDDEDDEDAMAEDSKHDATTSALSFCLPPLQPKPVMTQDGAFSQKSSTGCQTDKWAYESAVTSLKPHVFKKTQKISLEESFKLQTQQKEEYETIRAKQAAEKLLQQVNLHVAPSLTNPLPSYKFTNEDAKYRYRDHLEEGEDYKDNAENSESEEDEHKELSDED